MIDIEVLLWGDKIVHLPPVKIQVIIFSSSESAPEAL